MTIIKTSSVIIKREILILIILILFSKIIGVSLEKIFIESSITPIENSSSAFSRKSSSSISNSYIVSKTIIIKK